MMHLIAGKRVQREGFLTKAQYKFACTGEWTEFDNAYRRKKASGSFREIECLACLRIIRERKAREMSELADRIQELTEVVSS